MMFRELQQLSERVWIFPGANTSHEPTIGVIRGDKQTILINAGNSPRHARMLMAEMVGTDFPPIETVIYTQAHWTQTFGAVTFNPSVVIAHESTLAPLKLLASRQWTPVTLREESYRNPTLEKRNQLIMQAITDWRDFKIFTPTVTFEENLRLYLSETHYLDLVCLRETGGMLVSYPHAELGFVGNCGLQDDIPLTSLTPFSLRDLLAHGTLQQFVGAYDTAPRSALEEALKPYGIPEQNDD